MEVAFGGVEVNDCAEVVEELGCLLHTLLALNATLTHGNLAPLGPLDDRYASLSEKEGESEGKGKGEGEKEDESGGMSTVERRPLALSSSSSQETGRSSSMPNRFL